MIAIESRAGSLLKSVSPENGKVIAFHHLFGFVSEKSFSERDRNRRRHGFRGVSRECDFKFKFQIQDASVDLLPLENCRVEKLGPSGWTLFTSRGDFLVKNMDGEASAAWSPKGEKTSRDATLILVTLLLALFVGSGLFIAGRFAAEPEQAQIIEQATVKLAPEAVRPVAIDVPQALRNATPKQQDQIKRALQQSVGFLGLLGRKELTKALGGAPIKLKDSSAGAGRGGKQGSGGEQLLLGMGEGLQRLTVGNTGVVGLGGIGTKGAGGGQGGYGQSDIAGANGKSLASGPLSQDMVLEGGLDAAVVQATIAKYLNQVRACYEQGLMRNPGLGGFVRMFFEIGGTGMLNFAKVQQSTLGDPGVESCISHKMLGWKFPMPRGGTNVKVTYPFLLRSAAS